MSAIAVALSGENSSAGEIGGSAEVDEEEGDEDRQAAEDLDVEPDQPAADGRKWIVSSVPSTTPISVLPTSESAATRSMFGSPSWRT